MAQIKIALVQMDSRDDLEHNLGRITKFVRQAKEGGADLVAFPEFMNFLPFSRSNVYFEGEDGRTTMLLRRLAADYRIAIHAGSLLIDSGSERPYNQSFLVDPDGSIKGRYSKIHLFDGALASGERFREADLYMPGEQIVVSEILGIPAGTAICFDFRFPEIFRLMALAGAKLIFVPGNFTLYSGRHHLEAILRARAIENGVFILSADQVGEKKKSRSYGHSMVVGPDGEVRALKEDGEGLLFCEIDPKDVLRQRKTLPLLANAREDVYAAFRDRLNSNSLK